MVALRMKDVAIYFTMLANVGPQLDDETNSDHGNIVPHLRNGQYVYLSLPHKVN